MRDLRLILAAAALGLSAPLLAQDNASQQSRESGKSSTLKDAGDVASQPARDVGVAKTKIPPILIAAADHPYALGGLGTCARLASAVRALNRELGPDLASGEPGKKTNVAKVGGEAVVGSLVPFRGIVREVSGAAEAQRHLDAAIRAGFARRGFLRGVYQTRRCKPAL